MFTKKVPVELVYHVQGCECGGEFDIPFAGMLMSSPPQQKYKCNKCGKTELLRQEQFPHTETIRK